MSCQLAFILMEIKEGNIHKYHLQISLTHSLCPHYYTFMSFYRCLQVENHGRACNSGKEQCLSESRRRKIPPCISLRLKKLPKFAHEALTRLTRSCLLCGRRRRQEQESRRPPAFNDVVIPFSSECRRRRQIVGFLFTSTDTPKSCLQPRARWLWYMGWY